MNFNVKNIRKDFPILKKKINVFCEKPLSRSLDECKELYQLAKKNDAKLYVSDVELFINLKLKKNFKYFLLLLKAWSRCQILFIILFFSSRFVFIIFMMLEPTTTPSVKELICSTSFLFFIPKPATIGSLV
jgi:hypothetical protein